MEDDELMTTEQVARYCRTSPGTVRYWRHAACGPPGFKVGRRVLYPRRQLIAWLGALEAADAK